ncbi:hypothetical protein CIRG_00452 [Coccidioides immitis RMSCC 2394]|uniref:EGF-like domain-containing protein n=1 Tax=Coccidioides immitis RMSCC 2394 TaxID=404692 RepID=A0A0J6XY04_COCIT|nr:hypothetical protein CIRG_00452 [Coccidioides immitis RMSCC 2394]
MNDTRYEGANHGGKGSVRRAREMVQVGLSANGYSDNGRGRGNPAPHRLPVKRPPPVPAAFPPGEQGNRGPNMAPSQMSQWPLPDNHAGSLEMNRFPDNGPAPYRPGAQRPQRPPRPEPQNVPSPLDASRMRDYNPNIPYHQPPNGLEYQYEDPPRQYVRDFTSVSDQEKSPDTFSDPFSSPELSPDEGYQQRNQYLWPPSSRRGASSFYANNSNISPIQEESVESSPRIPVSYASSKVIPSSWGTAPIEAGSVDSPKRDSFVANDRDGEEGLVRQASVGKRAKPSLRTINKPQSGQNMDNESRRVKSQSGGEGKKNDGATSPRADAAAGMAPNTTDSRRNQQRAFGPHNATRFSSDSASSESSFDDLEKLPLPTTRLPTSLSEEELKELQLNHGIRAVPDSGLNRLDLKRPPPLNIDAVRDAEARGSLTSLPDLIRRATKLASNLDRGRTASRLGMLDMLNGSSDLSSGRARNSGSISDILASFPPPGPIGTPTAGSRGSAAFNNRANPNATLPDSAPEAPKRAEICCGMSRRTFVFIIFILFLLISSAVIIPVVLIVLPQERDRENSNRPTAAPSACETLHPCLNGGVSIGREGSCGCVCVNGFRGPRCALPGDSSCTSVDINEDYQNATVGDALPRLFEQSEANFSIPLNASKILGLFNEEDLSCTSENALVTFNGANGKRHFVIPDFDASGLGLDDDSLTPHMHHGRNHLPITRRDDQAATPTSSLPLDSQQGGATPESRRTSQAPLPPEVPDFGRVAVLFIFQLTEELRSATGAHDAIQGLLRIARSDPDVALQEPMTWKYGDHSISLDFRDFSIRLGDGTVLGGGQDQDHSESPQKADI